MLQVTSVLQFPMSGASSLLALGLYKCMAWELRWNLGHWNNDAASSYCASRFLITPAKQERTVYTLVASCPFSWLLPSLPQPLALPSHRFWLSQLDVFVVVWFLPSHKQFVQGILLPQRFCVLFLRCCSTQQRSPELWDAGSGQEGPGQPQVPDGSLEGAVHTGFGRYALGTGVAPASLPVRFL